MCFTGGFALAMMVDDSVAAPVLCQPSAPFAIGRRRGADLNLSPADLEIVKRRAAQGCSVLGLRYRKDPATGTRFDTLRHELGDNFIAVEFEGRGHAVVTAHRQQEAVDRVLAFFGERLTRPGGPGGQFRIRMSAGTPSPSLHALDELGQRGQRDVLRQRAEGDPGHAELGLAGQRRGARDARSWSAAAGRTRRPGR